MSSGGAICCGLDRSRPRRRARSLPIQREPHHDARAHGRKEDRPRLGKLPRLDRSVECGDGARRVRAPQFVCDVRDASSRKVEPRREAVREPQR